MDFRWEELIDSLQGTAGLGSSLPEDTVPSTPSETEADDDESIDDLPTPVAQTMTVLESNSSDPSSRLPHASPRRRAAQRDWESDHDGGAASAAASILSQDRNPRAGFILPSSSSRHTLRASTIYNPLDTAPPSPPGSHARDPSETRPSPFPSQHGSANSVSALHHFDESRPSSALSGKFSVRSNLSTDAEPETALPSYSRERARRDRVAAEKERKERDSARFKDVFGGLVGKRSGPKNKERDRED